MPTPADLPPVPPTHPDREILHQLEDTIEKLAALPGADWEWTVLRVGASGRGFGTAILKTRETISSASIFLDSRDSDNAFAVHALCKNAPSLTEPDSWSVAGQLFEVFGELGKTGLGLLNRHWVTDDTVALCHGCSGSLFWLLFVAGLSQQPDGPIARIPRV